MIKTQKKQVCYQANIFYLNEHYVVFFKRKLKLKSLISTIYFSHYKQADLRGKKRPQNTVWSKMKIQFSQFLLGSRNSWTVIILKLFYFLFCVALMKMFCRYTWESAERLSNYKNNCCCYAKKKKKISKKKRGHSFTCTLVEIHSFISQTV